jgi:hypothetical protein
VHAAALSIAMPATRLTEARAIMAKVDWKEGIFDTVAEQLSGKVWRVSPSCETMTIHNVNIDLVASQASLG